MGIKQVLLAAGIVLGCCACSQMDEQERFVAMDIVKVGRNVLVEDFTGQRCVNCPDATAELEKIQEQYGADTVIVVGIHSGPFAHRSTMSSPRLSLATETGDEYYKYWGVEAQPAIMVNRQQKILYDQAQYAAAVYGELQKTSSVTLNAHISISGDHSMLTVTANAVSDTNLDGKLQLWLIEDGITDMQVMPDGTVNGQYVHRHVFRTSLTPEIQGLPIHLEEDVPQSFESTMEIDKAWSVENLSVVAIVHTDEEGVIQVISKHINE